ERVHYLSDWDIAEVVQKSLGVVTVNSTVGTLALNEAKPVAALGHAVYKVPGIVHHGSLDAFWGAARQPDVKLYAAFKRVLEDRCLIRGGLLSEEGLQMLVSNAVERLERAPSAVLSMPRSIRRRRRSMDVIHGDAA
ncbi:MAG: capsular biosynthesis protein, partial [Erythrobacter sp.]|nr:capsular biosynthesis protein [Erythrobacter sp.]